MRASKVRDRFWIRTKNQAAQLAEKRSKFKPDEIIDFLADEGHNHSAFEVDSKNRMILVDKRTGNPLGLDERLIDDIAKIIGILSGKWVIFVEQGSAGRLWSKIKKLAGEGKIWSAKISTAAYPWMPKNKRVICVYTKNYLDKKDVMQAREMLRKNGIDDKLSYKPDIYTVLGIYPDNMESFHLKKIARYAS
jgi:hypothetical protein